MHRTGVIAFVALLLVACPPADQKKAAPRDQAGPCTKIGDTCEVSPGKLGTCVVNDGCTQGASVCFVCQSQH